MTSRIFNFNPGPATLPFPVLEQARDELIDYRETGMSLLEASHRGTTYREVHEKAIANLRHILDVPQNYAILLLQGGASLQFGMVPMNLLGQGDTADYTNSGAWAARAIQDARRVGNVHIAADSQNDVPRRVPDINDLNLTETAAYVHITSNETISGAQWKSFPKTQSPLVADMSSDILSRPLDISQFGLIYAGAQKNLGPSGVTVVIMRRDLADRAPTELPSMLTYKSHIDTDSMLNTPPCFSIYLLMLVTQAVRKAGIDSMHNANTEKAKRIYDIVDATEFYKGTAAKECRSDMNVTFRLTNKDLEETFNREAESHQLIGLKGHRSVGGLRASVYNAFPPKGIDALVAFMQDFERRHG